MLTAAVNLNAACKTAAVILWVSCSQCNKSAVHKHGRTFYVPNDGERACFKLQVRLEVHCEG